MTKTLEEQQHEFLVNAAEDGIRQLSAEIYRLIKLPYSSWKNQDKIRSLDKQIEYLEEVLAAFERDRKKQ